MANSNPKLPASDAASSPAVSENEAYQYCLGLLSRREHARRELRHKMEKAGVNAAVIECVLARLQADGYQCNQRFADSFTRSRIGKRHGIRKIRYELQQRGISDDIAEATLADYVDEELENAQVLIKRKAPKGDIASLLDDWKQKSKVIRSLINKGYDSEVIRLAFELLAEAA
ncbi:MAG: hypothetical protein CR957_00285 [Gammaproteobacteria bacterium]|nr:MAG: hypothetical protein CR957_00285 [Gammaproteobacteria bacterium]